MQQFCQPRSPVQISARVLLDFSPQKEERRKCVKKKENEQRVSVLQAGTIDRISGQSLGNVLPFPHLWCMFVYRERERERSCCSSWHCQQFVKVGVHACRWTSGTLNNWSRWVAAPRLVRTTELASVFQPLSSLRCPTRCSCTSQPANPAASSWKETLLW